MSDYGVTDKGFQMRRLDEIYTDICKRFKDEVGVDPSENPQSVMNVLFTIFADAPAELWETYAAAYQQLFPNTACGVALDNVMQVGRESMAFCGSAVALLAEGVDRNVLYPLWVSSLFCRPPRGGRG